MISIKKYLDRNHFERLTSHSEENEPFDAVMETFRGVLLAVGKAASQICSSPGEILEETLKGLEQRLSNERSPQAIRRIKGQLEVVLQEWSTRTSAHYKVATDEVKELLIALAKTAEAVGIKDQGFTDQFNSLTGRLEKIADLDDLTEIRASVVRNATEMKRGVEQMARESQELVSQLRAEITSYETRLKAIENLALKDELTGLANRRSIEERINWSIANQQEFCVALLDLNRFKFVNDTYGHLAGDNLLKQFAMDLKHNSRAGDQVGRWGGDEFILVLECGADVAKAHVGRIRDWVFGKYTVCGSGGNHVEIRVDASIGVTQWQPGESIEQLLTRADSEMYADKKQSRAAEARR